MNDERDPLIALVVFLLPSITLLDGDHVRYVVT
jgi:hypothetical protein